MANFGYELGEWKYTPRLPYVEPEWYTPAPMQAPTWNLYITNILQRASTTLDTYVAPLGARKIDTGAGNVQPLQNTGIVLYGNAPTSGIYTGVQME